MQISGITDAMRGALNSMQEGAFQKAGYLLNKNKDEVREEIQRQTAGSIEKVIAKLRDNKPISPQDKDLIKLWILGDAESYTMMENNFQDWINEYKRLLGVLESMERDSGSVQPCSKPRGSSKTLRGSVTTSRITWRRKSALIGSRTRSITTLNWTNRCATRWRIF